MWLTCLVYGDQMQPRCSHVSCFVGSKYIIFGGLNDFGFVTPEVAFFEVNNVRVKNLRSSHLPTKKIKPKKHKLNKEDEMKSLRK